MMFKSIDTLWSDIISRIICSGCVTPSRAGGVTEIVGYQGTLSDTSKNFLLNGRRALSPAYAAAELLWYLSGSSDIEMIKSYAPQYSKFAEKGIAWGAYGNRWFTDRSWMNESSADSRGQLYTVLDILRKKPDSRQALVGMWNAGDLWHAMLGDKKDIPCTMSWQFLIRADHLHMICTMRSNDCWLGLPYDIFANTSIQRLMAQDLGINPGWYIHQAGSEHLYDRNLQAATQSVMPPATFLLHDVAHLKSTTEFDLPTAACRAVKWERRFRDSPYTSQLMGDMAGDGCTGFLRDCVLACATSQGHTIKISDFQSPLMRVAMDRYRS